MIMQLLEFPGNSHEQVFKLPVDLDLVSKIKQASASLGCGDELELKGPHGVMCQIGEGVPIRSFSDSIKIRKGEFQMIITHAGFEPLVSAWHAIDWLSTTSLSVH